METLPSRSGYELHEIGITRRALVVMGAFFGLALGGFEVVVGLLEGRAAGSIFLRAVFTGVFLGVYFPWAVMWMTKRMNARVYAGNPRVVLPPPEGYRYRVPCMRMATPRRAVPGIMYLGPRGMRFDPLRRRLRARDRRSLVLEPLESITLERVDVPPSRRMRFLGHTYVPRINIHGGAECIQLMVPAPDATFQRLQDALQELRQAGDVGEVDPPASISRP